MLQFIVYLPMGYIEATENNFVPNNENFQFTALSKIFEFMLSFDQMAE